MLNTKNLRITTQGENSTAERDILAGWGLSIFTEAGQHAFLLDAGTTGAAATNEEKLGVGLTKTDSVVLSRGHYNYTGG